MKKIDEEKIEELFETAIKYEISNQVKDAYRKSLEYIKRCMEPLEENSN